MSGPISRPGKPIILESDGIMGQLPSQGVLDISGTAGPYFTVGGRGVLFDDGTSTAPGGSDGTTLQVAYDLSPVSNGGAGIVLSTGKDFVINDPNNDGNYFSISAATGTVTIQGNLIVQGSTTVIDTVIQTSDHWLIQPSSGTTTALSIQPTLGTIPLVDLMTVRRTFGSPPVFRIDLNGNLIASQNLTVAGLINGVDLIALNNEVQQHEIGAVGYRHEANAVDITPIPNIPNATNVQEALQSLSNSVGGQSVFGYDHIQAVPASVWTINHNRHTMRASVTIYDTTYEQIIPENVLIVDADNIQVSFGTDMAGSAVVILF